MQRRASARSAKRITRVLKQFGVQSGLLRCCTQRCKITIDSSENHVEAKGGAASGARLRFLLCIAMRRRRRRQRVRSKLLCRRRMVVVVTAVSRRRRLSACVAVRPVALRLARSACRPVKR